MKCSYHFFVSGFLLSVHLAPLSTPAVEMCPSSPQATLSRYWMSENIEYSGSTPIRQRWSYFESMPVPINVVSCAPQLLFVPYQPLPVISPSKLTSQLEIASEKSRPLPSCQMLPTFELVAILTLMNMLTVHTRNSTLLLSCNKDSKKLNWPLMQFSRSFAPRS